MEDNIERSRTGAAMQAKVWGRDPGAPATLVDEAWRDFVFAEVWTRPGLDLRARYLVSLAAAASSNGPKAAIDGYVRGALGGGELTLAELREAALHVAVYSGWDKGGELDAAISRVEAELGLEPARRPPLRAQPWDPVERQEKGFAEFNRCMTFDGPAVGNGVPYPEAGILNFVFGEMWCREGLDQRSRRWLTLVGVAESRTQVPIRSHFWSAMASGNCTEAELHEFVLQYAVHVGWPKASEIQHVVFEMAANLAAGKGYEG